MCKKISLVWKQLFLYDELYFAGRQHAKEAMSKRTSIMPSKHFIKTYFSSFIEDPMSHSLAPGKETDYAEADLRFVFIYLMMGSLTAAVNTRTKQKKKIYIYRGHNEIDILIEAYII